MVQAVVDALNQVLFVLGDDHVTVAELAGFATGGACVYLTVRATIWNFPVGLANSAMFLVLFGSARLWADSALQVVYLVLGVAGWVAWARRHRSVARRSAVGENVGAAGDVEVCGVEAGRAEVDGVEAGGVGVLSVEAGRVEVGERLTVRAAGRPMLLGCALFVALGTAGLTALLREVGDVAPFLDALTTSISLAAQFLLNAKRVESWWFWISADAIYVPLYASKDLVLTAIVYVLFLAMAIGGLRAWRRLAASEAPAVRVAAGMQV